MQTRQTEKKMNGGRIIAETLKAYGVSHVFYMEAMLRFASLEMESLGIRRIITHSEKAAAYMADGYARVSGRPGVCMAQSVGAANLAAGLQDARLGCSPVIALTGMKDPVFQNRNAYQELDHRLMYSTVTKMQAEIADPDQISHLFRHAFRSAVTGKPGPVHLDMPNHMGRTIELAESACIPAIDADCGTYPPYRPAADASRIAGALEVLKKAERPVIVVGGGARVSGAGAAIMALARKQEIPLVTTPDGKGEIDELDPLWGGIVGSYSIACANQIVNRADTVIYVGSQVSDLVTCDWTIPLPGTTIIQIDIEPAELGKNYPETLGIAGDARTVVDQLAAAVPKRNRREWLAEAAEYVALWHTDIGSKLTSGEIPIRTERLCHEIERILPENAVLVADTGYSAVWAATMIRIRPGQTFIRASGSLGWAYPASLGAKCGAPDRPVVCFTGDGAFYYHLAEMETAVRYGIKTVTIINNNQAYSQGVDEVKRVHREAGSAMNPENMYRFTPVNLARVAEEFGITAFRVENPRDLKDALKKAFACSGPVVVEVVTDINSRAAAAWKPEI